MTIPFGRAGTEAYHDSSHRRLLTPPVEGVPGRRQLDAIIVPTIRKADRLESVIALARKVDAALLLLCSGRARASEVAAIADRDHPVTAVDVTGLNWLMPGFETTGIHQQTQPIQPGDLSLKRNLGLIIARAAGWRYILFLDDDIDVPHPDELAEVASVASGFDAVGLNNEGFADNSVVCHALRLIGGRQDTFVGGGAMVVRPGDTTSFFPQIYNEDWLFLLREAKLGRVTTHGTMKQQPFDPFDTAARARGQEFGDCIAEGIYWLLDRGSPIRHADTAYWQDSLRRRRSLINHIKSRTVNVAAPPEVRARLIASLNAALEAHGWIRPALCDEYMKAWHRDRAVWRRHLRGHQMAATPRRAEAACQELGILANCDLRPAAPRAIRLSLPIRSETVNGCRLPTSVPPTIETSPVLSAI